MVWSVGTCSSAAAPRCPAPVWRAIRGGPFLLRALRVGRGAAGQSFVSLSGRLRRAKPEAEGDLLPSHAAATCHLEESGFQFVHLSANQRDEAQRSGDVAVVHLRLSVVELCGPTEQERHESDGFVRPDDRGMNLSVALLVGSRVALGDAKQGRVDAAHSRLLRLWGRERVGVLFRGRRHKKRMRQFMNHCQRIVLNDPFKRLGRTPPSPMRSQH